MLFLSVVVTAAPVSGGKNPRPWAPVLVSPASRNPQPTGLPIFFFSLVVGWPLLHCNRAAPLRPRYSSLRYCRCVVLPHASFPTPRIPFSPRIPFFLGVLLHSTGLHHGRPRRTITRLFLGSRHGHRNTPPEPGQDQGHHLADERAVAGRCTCRRPGDPREERPRQDQLGKAARG